MVVGKNVRITRNRHRPLEFETLEGSGLKRLKMKGLLLFRRVIILLKCYLNSVYFST